MVGQKWGELQQLDLQIDHELCRILVNFSFDLTKKLHLLLTFEKEANINIGLL